MLQHNITQKHIDKSLTYSEYIQLTDKLLAENKTTGPDQSVAIIDYTKLNRKRISRIEKTIHLKPELIELLQNLSKPMYWVVLSEPWCGDAAQNLPIIAKMADASPSIQLCILLRDENLDVMDAYLSEGTRSIPKLICLEQETMRELGQWGSRPEPANKLLIEHKKNLNETKAEFINKMQLWYKEDKGASIQQEFLALIKAWQKAAIEKLENV
ncbi:MAG: thioredoxin family protein [Bacteroidia bacterium]